MPERVCYGCNQRYNCRSVGQYFCDNCRRDHYSLTSLTDGKAENNLTRAGFTLVSLPELLSDTAQDNPQD